VATVLAMRTCTAVQKNATVKKLIKCFTYLVTKSSKTFSVALVPELLQLFMTVEDHSVYRCFFWFASNVGKFSLSRAKPCGAEYFFFHIIVFDRERILVSGLNSAELLCACH